MSDIEKIQNIDRFLDSEDFINFMKSHIEKYKKDKITYNSIITKVMLDISNYDDEDVFEYLKEHSGVDVTSVFWETLINHLVDKLKTYYDYYKE